MIGSINTVRFPRDNMLLTMLEFLWNSLNTSGSLLLVLGGENVHILRNVLVA